MTIQLTPQQQMAIAFRGFDPLAVEVERVGRDYRASVTKETPRGPERIEVLAWSAEVAINRLSQFAVRS